MTAALYTYLTRLIYRTCTWPLSQSLKWWVLFIPNYIIVDYMVAPFDLLSWTDGIAFLRTWHFWGHWTILGMLVFFTLLQAVRT